MTEHEFLELLAASYPDQESAIMFSKKLLSDWMRKNTLEGMTIQQSLWVFSRIEDFSILIDGTNKKVDLFKMFQSGAIHTLYYCILRFTADDMSKPYHWVTQERINWVKAKIEEYLGAPTCAYIQTLD